MQVRVRAVPAPRDRRRRRGAADLDVLLRAGATARSRRLPRRGARQRRPAHRQRLGRAAVAAAAQSAGPRDLVLRRREPAVLRADPARPRLRALPTPRPTTSCGRAPGSSPARGWGDGAVMLVEIPIADEFTDNIVAFWRPEAPLAAGNEIRYAYRLTWAPTQPEDAPLARSSRTRSGLSIIDARERRVRRRLRPRHDRLHDLTPRLEASAGEVKGCRARGCRPATSPGSGSTSSPGDARERRVPPLAGERGPEGVGNLALPVECVRRRPTFGKAAGRRPRPRQDEVKEAIRYILKYDIS